MQVRSKNGVRVVKLAADEKRALTKAANLCCELGQLSQGAAADLARKCEQALDALLESFEPEPEVVG